MNNSNKKIIIILAILLLGVLLLTAKLLAPNNVSHQDVPLNSSTSITTVPTQRDELLQDSTWCGTFQLVWNDMKNEIVKKDIIFTPQLTMVENLNAELFTQSMLSEDYYFKIYGLKTLDLKTKIEQGIWDKFQQRSDILDSFDWSSGGVHDDNNPDVQRYFLYTMLYRKFEFLNKFDELKTETFGKQNKQATYFGINNSSSSSLDDQMTVLFYHSKDNFAIQANTKTGDEVIFYKNPRGKTFEAIYDNMQKESKSYRGSKSFLSVDEFKAPKLDFNLKREYSELANKPFPTSRPGYDGEILKALQTIKLSLDATGGEIKSEAAIGMRVYSMALPSAPPKTPDPRYFYVDDTFTLFLRQTGQSQPYFAARIEDIDKFQLK